MAKRVIRRLGRSRIIEETDGGRFVAISVIDRGRVFESWDASDFESIKGGCSDAATAADCFRSTVDDLRSRAWTALLAAKAKR